MKKRAFIIAIDGYSSTGKSTLAKTLAKRYNLTYVDTGALYRGVTLAALRANIDIEKRDSTLYSSLLKSLSLQFKVESKGGEQQLYLNGENVEKEIRSLEIASAVSKVAPIKVVRNFVDSQLKKYGERGGVIMEGRDIGTVVLPHADLKIFMVADAKIRAERRYREMVAKGYSAQFEEVLANIEERDRLDETRESAPLRKAEDAIVLDNTFMTIDQQQLWVEKIIQEKWGSSPK